MKKLHFLCLEEEGRRKSGDSEYKNSFEEFWWEYGNEPEEGENLMMQETEKMATVITLKRWMKSWRGRAHFGYRHPPPIHVCGVGELEVASGCGGEGMWSFSTDCFSFWESESKVTESEDEGKGAGDWGERLYKRVVRRVAKWIK